MKTAMEARETTTYAQFTAPTTTNILRETCTDTTSEDGNVREESGEETAMVRYECFECSMTATCVLNEAAMRSWRDHMAGHAHPFEYGAWTWGVSRLPFQVF